jgi:hypothetical protein
MSLENYQIIKPLEIRIEDGNISAGGERLEATAARL